FRRGKPTCHKAFDEATAILAGDALLTLSFEILSRSGLSNPHALEEWLRVIKIIASAAGVSGMIEGQMRDISFEGIRLDSDQLESLHLLKTGALIQASVESGAVLGKADSFQIRQLTIYAKNIGLAFQVVDDLLNVEGDSREMGKAVGTDNLKKKSTYPSLLGMEQSKSFAVKLINNALQALSDFDNRSDPLRAVAEYILKRRR
ncbi:MAG: polyprenyl synthetase family protein, partial [Thermodesulfobacteriota bacterium]